MAVIAYVVSDVGAMSTDIVDTHVLSRDIAGYNECTAVEVSVVHLGDML